MDMDDLLELAERQHGYVTRWDARSAGLSRSAVRTLLHRGDWEVDGPRLLRRRGAPRGRASRLMRSVLDAGPGAFLSHGPAADWWGLPGFDASTIDVTRPRGANGHPPALGQRVHEVLHLGTDQVTVLGGIAIVRPERLAFELFATCHPLRAARAIETAWSKGLLSGGSLLLVFEQLAGRGRAGTVAMRAFLESHPVDWVPPASNLEARFQSIMDGALLGRWRRQVDLGDRRWCGRVDFLSEHRPLVVEVQSERYHTALFDRAHDVARRARLEAAGFVVVEVWDRDVWHDKAAVIAAVRPPYRRLGPYRPAA